MTRAELDQSNVENILGTGKVTKVRHGTHNTNIADYVDESILAVDAKIKVPSITYTLSISGISFTDSSLIGRTVYLVVLSDATKNSGFTKPLGSGVFTFTDGTTFGAGQILTLLLI
jgi:di/tricarboxylate transporter